VTHAVGAKSERFRIERPFDGLETIAWAGTEIGDNDGDPVRTPTTTACW